MELFLNSCKCYINRKEKSMYAVRDGIGRDGRDASKSKTRVLKKMRVYFNIHCNISNPSPLHKADKDFKGKQMYMFVHRLQSLLFWRPNSSIVMARDRRQNTRLLFFCTLY